MNTTKKNKNKKYVTDKNTDYLFDLFMNEEKFNEQLRAERDEELEKKIEKLKHPPLDSRVYTDKDLGSNRKIVNEKVPTEKNNTNNHNNINTRNKSVSSTTTEEPELPSNKSSSSHSSNKSDRSTSSDRSDKTDVDFNDSERSNSESSTKSGARTPYGAKINAAPIAAQQLQNQLTKYQQNNTYSDNRQQSGKFRDQNDRSKEEHNKPLLGDKLVDDIEKYIETPEEKRARARESYAKLQDLVVKYNVNLSRSYSINDDPDEMEAEYKLHKDRRNKENQVKWYKRILITIVSGAEFVNEKYNPFEFKLKDWSKQVAADVDEYTEILEEIYEKYKHVGGKMAPELKLLFMIILSGVTFHLSQTLFGSATLGNVVQNNPNIINQLMGGLMKGGIGNLLGGGGDKNEPVPEEKPAPHSNNDILNNIRKYNQAKKTGEKIQTRIQLQILSQMYLMIVNNLKKREENLKKKELR